MNEPKHPLTDDHNIQDMSPEWRPVISVIMYTFNVAQHVGEAMDSILEQTFTDFEFIIIDDGSQDNTWPIVNSYNDKRIVAFRNEGGFGKYSSLNKGLNISRGKYIAIMEANCVAYTNRLKIQHLLIRMHHAVALSAQCETFLPVIDYPIYAKEMGIALLDNACMLHSALFARADILRQLNGYNEDFHYASDYDLQCRLSLQGDLLNLPAPNLKCCYPREEAVYRKRENLFIQSRYQEAFINHYKAVGQEPVTAMETACPEMGKVIAYYTLAKVYPDEGFDQKADELLDQITENADLLAPRSEQNKLLNIGCGILYLFHNGFAEGDADDILEDVDNWVFQTVFHYRGYANLNWAGLLYYLRKRSTLKSTEALLHLLDLLERQLPLPITNQLIRYELEALS